MPGTGNQANTDRHPNINYLIGRQILKGNSNISLVSIWITNRNIYICIQNIDLCVRSNASVSDEVDILVTVPKPLFPLTKASDTGLWCFFHMCLNERLSKQSKHRWFETPSCSLWRHSNDRSQQCRCLSICQFGSQPPRRKSVNVRSKHNWL